MSHKDFYELFLIELRDIYDGEKQMTKALPAMINAAHSKDLKDALRSHLEETKNQVKRLDAIASELNVSLSGETCKAMQGLVKEAQDAMKTNFQSVVKDAAIISYAQRVEHYEISVYGTLKTFAKHLDLPYVKQLLEDTLKEEAHADKKLTEIAEGSLFSSGLNTKAKKAA